MLFLLLFLFLVDSTAPDIAVDYYFLVNRTDHDHISGKASMTSNENELIMELNDYRHPTDVGTQDMVYKLTATSILKGTAKSFPCTVSPSVKCTINRDDFKSGFRRSEVKLSVEIGGKDKPYTIVSILINDGIFEHYPSKKCKADTDKTLRLESCTCNRDEFDPIECKNVVSEYDIDFVTKFKFGRLTASIKNETTTHGTITQTTMTTVQTIPTTTATKPKTTTQHSNDPFDPDKDPCKDPSATIQTADLCKILENGQISSKNFDSYVDDTKKTIVTDKATPGDVMVVSEIFAKMASVEDATSEQRVGALSLLDHVLSIKDEVFIESTRKASDKYLASMHKILNESKSDLSYLHGDHIGAQRTTLNCDDSGNGWFGIWDENNKFQAKSGDVESTRLTSSIELSRKSLCRDKSSTASAYFVIHRNSKLFFRGSDHLEDIDYSEKPESSNQLSLIQRLSSTSNNENSKKNRCKKIFDPTNGIILTSVFIGKNGSLNKIDARMRFKKEKIDLPFHSNLVVTWWDKTEWSSDRQCALKLEEGQYVARCDHLTNFALLVEKATTDPVLCDKVLDRLGFWLNIVSVICLLVLVLIYSTRLIPVVKDSIFIRILNNNRRSGNDTYTVLYTVITLAFYLIFLLFVDQSATNSTLVCKLVAALLYALFLSSMFLNVFQAWNMIILCAWSSRVERNLQSITRIWIGLPVSIGVPTIVVLVIWFADTSFFFRNDQFCWISSDNTIYAILIPVTLMLINSLVTFAIFCVRMFPGCFGKLNARRTSVRIARAERRTRLLNLELFMILIFAQFTLGFPWMLHYPAMFSSKTTVWHYLFSIFNSSNGLILFSMYVYSRAYAFYRVRNSSMTSTTRITPSTEITEEEHSIRKESCTTIDTRSSSRGSVNTI